MLNRIEFIVIVEHDNNGFGMRYDRRAGVSEQENLMIEVLMGDLSVEARRLGYRTTGPHRVVAIDRDCNDQWAVTFDPIELTPVSEMIQ